MPDQATCQARFEKSLQYYLDQGYALEDMRDDIRCRPLAIELGYTVIYGACFGAGLTFEKANKTLWDTSYPSRSGTPQFTIVTQWTAADLIDDTKVSNHRHYPSLEEALRKEA